MADENKSNEYEKRIAELATEAATQKARADQASARADQAEKDRDALRVEASDAKKDLSREKLRADKAEADAKTATDKAHQDGDEAFNARVNARVDLLAVAAPIIGKDAKGQPVDISTMSDRAIKTAVVKHVDSEDIADNESIDYVNGMYKGAIKRAGAVVASHAAVRTQVVKARRDNAPVTKGVREAEAEAMAAMQSDTTNAWTQR